MVAQLVEDLSRTQRVKSHLRWLFSYVVLLIQYLILNCHVLNNTVNLVLPSLSLPPFIPLSLPLPLSPSLPPLLSLFLITQSECDMSYGEDFRYSVLCEELVVGEVYVRVYNDQPTYVLEVSCRTDGLCCLVDLCILL